MAATSFNVMILWPQLPKLRVRHVKNCLAGWYCNHTTENRPGIPAETNKNFVYRYSVYAIGKRKSGTQCGGISETKFLMEVVGLGRCVGNLHGQNAMSFHGNDIV